MFVVVTSQGDVVGGAFVRPKGYHQSNHLIALDTSGRVNAVPPTKLEGGSNLLIVVSPECCKNHKISIMSLLDEAEGIFIHPGGENRPVKAVSGKALDYVFGETCSEAMKRKTVGFSLGGDDDSFKVGILKSLWEWDSSQRSFGVVAEIERHSPPTNSYPLTGSNLSGRKGIAQGPLP